MNENTIIVVPDVHGRTFWHDVEKTDPNQEIVFLGDYVDPYGYEGITDEMAISELLSIIDFKKSRMDKVKLLIGNHVAHYVGLSMDTARYSSKHDEEIYGIMNENSELFQHAYRWNDTLFTHAGVTKTWLNQNDLDWGADVIADKLNEGIVFRPRMQELMRSRSRMSCSFPSIGNPIGDIGYSRGGDMMSGSPIWADLVGDLVDDAAYDGELIQIVGHTQLNDTGRFVRVGNVICCDSRACFTWDGNEMKKL